MERVPLNKILETTTDEGVKRYNKKGILVYRRDVVPKEEGTDNTIVELWYNSKDQLIKDVKENEEGTHIQTTYYLYNDHGTCISSLTQLTSEHDIPDRAMVNNKNGFVEYTQRIEDPKKNFSVTKEAHYEYDENGNVIKETHTDVMTLDFTYDEEGNLCGVNS